MDLFVAGQDQSAADQPNIPGWRSSPIVTIVTIERNNSPFSDYFAANDWA